MNTLDFVGHYFDLLFFTGVAVLMATGALGIHAFRRKRLLRGLSWLALGIPLAFLCLVVPKRAALAALQDLGGDPGVSTELASLDTAFWERAPTEMLRGARPYRRDYGSQPTGEGYRLRVCDRAAGDCRQLVLQRDSRGGNLYWLMLLGRNEARIPLGFLPLDPMP